MKKIVRRFSDRKSSQYDDRSQHDEDKPVSRAGSIASPLFLRVRAFSLRKKNRSKSHNCLDNNNGYAEPGHVPTPTSYGSEIHLRPPGLPAGPARKPLAHKHTEQTSVKYIEAVDISNYGSSEHLNYRNNGDHDQQSSNYSDRLPLELPNLAHDKELNEAIELSFRSNFPHLQEKRVSVDSVPSVQDTLKAPSHLLTDAQISALDNAFRVGDVEDRGVVDVTQVQYIAQQVLGDVLTINELKSVIEKAETMGATTGVLNIDEFKEVMIDLLHTTTTRWGSLQTPLDGYVGFDTVLEQQRKKFLKKGFEFNLMVVGESGLGKSTLVNTLFKSKVSRTSCTSESPRKIPKTVEIDTVTHVIEEKNVRLRLSITDTPGFGDQVNNENCWLPIYDQVNKQFDNYLKEEMSVNRRKLIPDSRIHCCLYFIAPTGHGLKALDISCMKKLHDVVNIIPVIAKSDTMTLEERDSFKERIKQDITEAAIKIYPCSMLTEDEDVLAANAPIRKHIPLAVVGSDRAITINNKSILGRQTKWGFVEVENPNHCEFSLLRDMLLRTHMQDLKDTTHEDHYENYRRQKLSKKPGENNGA